MPWHQGDRVGVPCHPGDRVPILGIPVDLRLNRSRGSHHPVYGSRFCLVNRTESWDTSVNWRLSARITCPDVGTKVLVRSLGGLEDGGGLLCPGSFTHRAKPLS
jgi:hypothetical protein